MHRCVCTSAGNKSRRSTLPKDGRDDPVVWLRAKSDGTTGFGVLDCLDLFDEKLHGIVDEKVDLLLYRTEGQDRLTGDGGTIEADDAEILRKLAEAFKEVIQGNGGDIIAAAEETFSMVRPGVDDAVNDRNDF